jgi:hypothetical protein
MSGNDQTMKIIGPYLLFCIVIGTIIGISVTFHTMILFWTFIILTVLRLGLAWLNSRFSSHN